MAAKGLGIQFVWWDHPFIIKNIRSMGQCIAFICAGVFYIKFYKYNKSTKWILWIFKASILVVFTTLLLYLAKYIFGGLSTLYIYVWIILQVLVVIFVLLHIVLAYNSVVPYYLSFAFSLPIIVITVAV